jgi:hypothetical protein
LNFDGKVIVPSIKDKKIILVLDNVDDFLNKNSMHFYEEMNALKNELPRSKILLVMKKESFAVFSSEKLHS